MKRKLVSRTTSTLLMIGILSILLPQLPLGEASPLTVLSVSPATIEDPALGPGSTFVIDITIADVQSLWGYQFILSYSTEILTATDFGIYLPFENMILPWSRINDTEGNVYLAAYTYMGDLDGLTTIDPAPIAWIEFIVDDVGTSVLDVHDSLLSDPSGNPIPHEVVDGYFDNRGLMDEIRRLIEVIRTWNLPKGTEKSLISKLEDALHLLEMGNEDGAVSELRSFISKVEALRGKKLTNEQADYLVSEAQRIIGLFSG